MTERNAGEEVQRRPLGGCGDGADPPSIKLIIENMGKSYHCGCSCRMEAITWLSAFEWQGRTHGGFGQKKYPEREKGY